MSMATSESKQHRPLGEDEEKAGKEPLRGPLKQPGGSWTGHATTRLVQVRSD